MSDEWKTCPRCAGSGKVLDARGVGTRFRTLRIESEISLRSMAKRLGISAAFLSDMELGRRGWSLKRMRAYELILKNR